MVVLKWTRTVTLLTKTRVRAVRVMMLITVRMVAPPVALSWTLYGQQGMRLASIDH
jgi:hypothetical protein